MAAAVHFFATAMDETALLDHLGEPGVVSLHPWPVVDPGKPPLRRTDLGDHRKVTVHNPALGGLVLARPGDAAFEGGSAGALFNRMNWERLSPARGEALVDSNRCPALLWDRGLAGEGVLSCGSLGSQADAMEAISDDYAAWARRAMAWIRRKGTKVWGLETASLRPDLDIDLHHVSAVYALPGALVEIESGGRGR